EIFYDNELAYRRITGYPPFSQMLSVLVLSEDKKIAWQCIQELAEGLRQQMPETALIGPAEAGLTRAKDRYRVVFYVKVATSEDIRNVKGELEQISHERKWEKSCSVQFDWNPLSGY
ncbi:MAG: primosomal protein N', partial [Eubacterium sp.]|nr:primosomal protein N' [Eubacterium sp.]